MGRAQMTRQSHHAHPDRPADRLLAGRQPDGGGRPGPGDPGPGAGRGPSGRAGHARAVRDRHGAECGRLDVEGTGPPPSQPAPGGRPAPAGGAGRGAAASGRSGMPSRRPSSACRSGSGETLLAHEVSGQDTRSLARRAGLDRGCGRRAAEPERVLGCGSSTCWPCRTSNRRPIGVVRCCSRCPAATGADSGRSTPPGTCWSASCARELSRAVDGARSAAATTRCGSRSTATPDIVRGAQGRSGAGVPRRLLADRPDADRHGGLGDRPQHRAVRRQRARSSIELLEQPRRGVRVVARDTGPGIADVEQALTDGYSTYNGWAWDCRAPAG